MEPKNLTQTSEPVLFEYDFLNVSLIVPCLYELCVIVIVTSFVIFTTEINSPLIATSLFL
jgi:hypothetical protein